MKLLISVVSLTEAQDALAGGAVFLDVKNPAEGSLGANYPRVIQAVRDAAPAPIEVSAAIGDMPNLPGTAALAACAAATLGADYVKVGLHGPKNASEAVFLMKEVQAAVQDYPHSKIIAAGYADYQRAGTLNPALLPGIAAQAGVAGCMLDTAIKDGRGLFDLLDPDVISRIIEEAHRYDLLVGLAGSLKPADLLLAKQMGADVAGVRTAVCCHNRRDGTLNRQRVRGLHRLIKVL